MVPHARLPPADLHPWLCGRQNGCSRSPAGSRLPGVATHRTRGRRPPAPATTVASLSASGKGRADSPPPRVASLDAAATQTRHGVSGGSSGGGARGAVVGQSQGRGQPAVAGQPDAVILATGTDACATGGVAHTQAELAEVLCDAITSGSILCCPTSVAPSVADQAAKVRRMFDAVGVHTRGSRFEPARFFEPERHNLGNTPGSCVERFLLPRLQAAAQQALDGWAQAGGRGAPGVTDLIVGGLTAPRATPGPDVLLAHSLGLPPDVRRVPLHHLGCLGGYRALALAADIARGDPEACVLVVYGDVSSLIGASLQSPMNEADLLSVAIFSDGAAAALVGGSSVAAALGASSAGQQQRGPAAARIVASRCGLLRAPGGESTEHEMWLRETGFRPDGSIYGQNFVGKAVPKHLMRALPRFVGDMLKEAAQVEQEQGRGASSGAGAPQPMAPLSDMMFLCHPGGPAILDVAARALELQPWQLEHSWRVLRERGNMSGATNLFVMHHWLQAGAPGARHAAGVAFGPGLAVEGVLLEAL